MADIREPVLLTAALTDLHPTQISVGMREVENKRENWREKEDDKKSLYLGSHLIPVVLGDQSQPFVVDHHHLCRALLEEGVTKVALSVMADLSSLEKDHFWFVMDSQRWMHPFDEKGIRRSYQDIPDSLTEMKDDPYRSLAGSLRRAGGYAKDVTPFSEFLWADYLRRQFNGADIAHNFNDFLEKALILAHDKKASYLPGWCAPQVKHV
ncbi:putative ParB-like nuclease [Zymomonas mobilis subsp. mobilis ZM4 = ATCC 31821]|uniref:ParB-like nuclease n=2 Tax=Zymomonas mobilis subsp. mobilis TaxID=120045 RepID=Q5NQN0_ZYMMO|nr:ParB-like protein [Zymomonas mobilis]AAV88974.1 Putative ParB-like nuclease [Zymomonas mobilis subsp. mobilis ZM4 = ATCC 31821]ACV75434.1 Putative ParB-like nuclease [Zymomonas mobilis subsp. mobilis NCIMB 11163]AEH62729.1 Putative ParB-like nuclease [Zymomonas mobilis subsp. mobilis ATCC 10988]AVZ25333.1 putative ParB-like nuclease [Zymomonas mobilis subsp. mobilis]AVZ27224.1 putative ParB-like nuclease [Zymomonas mobilis subsp. mobilis]